MSTLIPSNGFILIKPENTNEFFTNPELKGNLRIGRVIKTGAHLIHASGKDLPPPVKEGVVAVFQYLENQDISIDGQNHYLVPFNLITAYYGE